MRSYVSAVLAATLIASSALADDGALAPGKPAGVKQAQMTDTAIWVGVGIAAVGAGIAAALSSTKQAQAPITTTVTTAP